MYNNIMNVLKTLVNHSHTRLIFKSLRIGFLPPTLLIILLLVINEVPSKEQLEAIRLKQKGIINLQKNNEKVVNGSSKAE